MQNSGLEEEDAMAMAEVIYTEMLAYAQEITNMTVEELREQGGGGQGQAPPQEQPQPSVVGGPNG